MKTRFGFVSNSSTTSFCIYGASLDQLPDYDSEAFYKKLHKAGQPLDTFDYCEVVFLGRSLTEIGDDQTFGEFKAAVESGVEQLLGSRLDCGIHERAEANY